MSDDSGDRRSAPPNDPIVGLMTGISVLIAAMLVDKAVKASTFLAVIDAAQKGLTGTPELNTPDVQAVLKTLRHIVVSYPASGIDVGVGDGPR